MNFICFFDNLKHLHKQIRILEVETYKQASSYLCTHKVYARVVGYSKNKNLSCFVYSRVVEFTTLACTRLIIKSFVIVFMPWPIVVIYTMDIHTHIVHSHVYDLIFLYEVLVADVYYISYNKSSLSNLIVDQYLKGSKQNKQAQYVFCIKLICLQKVIEKWV